MNETPCNKRRDSIQKASKAMNHGNCEAFAAVCVKIFVTERASPCPFWALADQLSVR